MCEISGGLIVTASYPFTQQMIAMIHKMACDWREEIMKAEPGFCDGNTAEVLRHVAGGSVKDFEEIEQACDRLKRFLPVHEK